MFWDSIFYQLPSGSLFFPDVKQCNILQKKRYGVPCRHLQSKEKMLFISVNSPQMINAENESVYIITQCHQNSCFCSEM
jgi:hypothetical protein